MGAAAPFFSVVIPLLNKGASVESALLSVVAQEFEDFEVIVVDDGSTDDGPEVVSRLRDCRIRLVRQKHSGVSVARNRGVAESRASHIAFLDADDLWEPTFLSAIFDLVSRHPDACLYATGYKIVGLGRVHTVRCAADFRDDVQPEVIRHFFRAAWSGPFPVITSCVCVSKHALESIGGFPKGIESGQDQAVWARLALASDAVVGTSCDITYHLAETEHSTVFRFFGLKSHFDFLSLLEGHAASPQYTDLERWVEQKMYDLAMIALVHGNDRRAAELVLRRVTSRHWRVRRLEVQAVRLLPIGARRAIFRHYQKIKT